MRTRCQRGLFIAVVVALVAATGSAQAALLARHTVPDGYKAVTVKAVGLALALPETWLALDPKSRGVEKLLDAADEANPNLGIKNQFDAVRQNVDFWAADTGTASFSTNLLVLATPFSTSVLKDPHTAEQELAASLGDKVHDVQGSKTRVAGVMGLAITYNLDVTRADGSPVTSYGTIFLIPTKKGVMDVTYTSGTDPAHDDTLKTIMKASRVL